MTRAALIYPHQLFRDLPWKADDTRLYLIEEPLLFTQFRFHKQKLVLHRASMKRFAARCKEKGYEVRYIESADIKKTGDIAEKLKADGVDSVCAFDPVDDWLERRVTKALKKADIELHIVDTPMFLNTREDIEDKFANRSSFHMADFYKEERKRLDILMDEDGSPVGGKYSFDAENRKKLPKGIELPEISRPETNEFVEEAIEYVNRNFSSNYGKAEDFAYPVSHDAADEWLERFLKERLEKFGDYEDAIAKDESFVFHSVLTPMLNIGLLTPRQIVDRTLDYASENDVPLNSLEGFIRQIIGWREFMRGIYVAIGRKQRTKNFWNHDRKLPETFWTAETGIDPIDETIRKSLRHAYNHHIERLMVLGNFMLLTEIDPDDAYRWFMEMYIDAYDWVMVPNVYGMSLYSDGGMITTKPYISGSNYIRKMSDYGTGDWSEVWDGLYWRFIDKHKDMFLENPRLSMMPRMLENMDKEKRESHKQNAANFLRSLTQQAASG